MNDNTEWLKNIEYKYKEESRKAKAFEYTNKWYWISVLRGINRIIHFDLHWDFKNENWRLK